MHKQMCFNSHCCLNSAQHPPNQHWLGMQELHLTGCAVLTDEMCIVVAEGGIKAHKKYTKLMTQRIKWTVVPEEEEAGELQLCSPCAQDMQSSICCTGHLNICTHHNAASMLQMRPKDLKTGVIWCGKGQ